MKNRKLFIFPVFFILSFIALVMKKLMFPFHGLFLILIFDGMAILYFMQAFRSEKLNETIPGRSIRFDISSITYAILYRLEYWNGWEGWITAAGILFFIVSMLTFFSLTVYMKLPERKNKVNPIMLANLSWIYFLVLFPPVALTNPRTFHNLFNGTTYEEYVRSNYSLEEGNALIAMYKPGDSGSKETAESYNAAAIQAEQEGDYEEALKNYNHSIDLDPDNANAIYNRGRIKLTRLEIDSDMAQSAYNDFTRAIQLDPHMAVAFYNRAVAHNYLFPKDRLPVRIDLMKAKEIDTSFNSDKFLNDYLALPLSDSTIDTTTDGDLNKGKR